VETGQDCDGERGVPDKVSIMMLCVPIEVLRGTSMRGGSTAAVFSPACYFCNAAALRPGPQHHIT
jgi:hypothetical protein